MPQSQTSKRLLTISRGGAIGFGIVLVVALICVRLAFWQLARLQQKRAHNAALESRMALPVLRLSPLRQDSSDLVFRRVAAAGTYDGDRTIVLAGRSLRGVPGVHVLTPLRLGPAAVLVNRGWLPASDGATIDLAPFLGETAAEIVGVALPLPVDTRTPAAETTAFRRVWFRVNPQALRGQFPYLLFDYQVRLLADSAAPAYALTQPSDSDLHASSDELVRLGPPTLDEGPHLGYAIQWFSFAAIAIVGWTILLLRSGELKR